MVPNLGGNPEIYPQIEAGPQNPDPELVVNLLEYFFQHDKDLAAQYKFYIKQ